MRPHESLLCQEAGNRELRLAVKLAYCLALVAAAGTCAGMDCPNDIAVIKQPSIME